MSIIIPQQYATGPRVEIGKARKQELYNKRYPDGINLRPDSKLHSRLIQKLKAITQESYDSMSKRRTKFKHIDRALTLYIDPDVEEEAKEDKDIDVPVIMPESYAVLEILMTYMVSAFLSQDPIFKYKYQEPGDLINVAMLEKVIAKQMNYFKVALNLYTMWRDSYAYGIGVVIPTWEKHWGKRITAVELANGTRERMIVPSLLMEGNGLVNISPYNFLPDPNVPIQSIQKGAFVGSIDTTNKMNLLSEEIEDDLLFNCAYVQTDIKSLMSMENDYDSNILKSGSSAVGEHSKKVERVRLYVNVIPKHWGLGKSENPEKWEFQYAGETIISAGPLDTLHELYPVITCAPDMDGYSVAPLSRMEVIHGLQNLIDFLATNHMANQTRCVNNVFVADPQRIYIPDFEAARSGGIIRTRPRYWGLGVKDAIEQLRVDDVTSQNLAEIRNLSMEAQNKAGAVNTLQGPQRTSGERVSASEYRGTRSSALSRVEKGAKLISIQAHGDIARMFAWHTQQYMSQQLYVDIVGRFQKDLADEYGVDASTIEVTPDTISVPFDLDPADASVPSGEFADVLVQALQVMASNDQLMAEFDVPRFFTHALRVMGIENPHEFRRIKPQVVPDAQAGNNGRTALPQENVYANNA